MLHNLHDSIVDYDITMLRAVARVRGFELQAMRQPDAVEELRAYLLDREATDWALSRLPAEPRLALDVLLRAGGQMKAHIFFNQFGEPRAMGPGRLERERPWLAPESPTEHLWFRGLLYTTFQDVGEGYRAQFAYVPSDLVPLLPEVEVVAPRFEVTPVDAPIDTRSRGIGLVADLFRLLVHLQMNPRSDDPTRRSAALDSPAVSQNLREHADYVDFLLHLAQVSELVHGSARDLRPNPGPVREWLKWPAERQIYGLQSAWRADPTWDELRNIPDLAIEETGWRNDAVRTRQALLGHLGRCPTDLCPVDVWLSVASLAHAVKTVDPDFARPDGDYRSWYIRDVATGEYLMGFSCWDDVEARLIVRLLTGPLFWLGAVDLGYDGASLTAFRLASPGHALLGKASPPSADEAPPPTATVLPDFTVHFEPGARLYEQFQAARFSQRVNEDEGAVYRITQRALAAARDQGISPQMILTFLKRISMGPLPENVVSGLRKWDSVAPS